MNLEDGPMNIAPRLSRWPLLLLSTGCLLEADDRLLAQARYQKPPREIQEVLSAPPTPTLSLSPTRGHLLMLQGQNDPSIADLAQPMLRLAGVRINPQNNAPHAPPRIVAMKLIEVATGQTRPIELPADPYLSGLQWAPDGQRFAFLHITPRHVSLWLGDVATGTVRQVPGVEVNAAFGEPIHFLPGSKALLCRTVPADRGQPPARAVAPPGPKILESSGKSSPARTYQDLLQDEHDEQLYEYYGTAQLVRIDVAGNQLTPVGKPALLDRVDPSPDGKYLLVARHHRPFSYLLPASSFPREVEVWDQQGKVVHTLASLPLADLVPIEGVPTGPRLYHWQPDAPATLVWVEALDDGDPRKKVTHRDQLFRLASPFQSRPVPSVKTQHRFAGLGWMETGLAFFREYDRNRKWQRTFLLDSREPDPAPRLVWDKSINERYADPGQLVMKTLPSGKQVVHLHQDRVFLIGEGASPQGSFPFLDSLDVKTLGSKRLYQCSGQSYETPLALLTEDGREFLTRYESQAEPANFLVRSADGAKKALTHFTDPTPQLRQIKKELVTYRRDDGVGLSFTLYLPPDYQPGQRRPAVVWAYPREFADADTAGQVSGSPHHFVTMTGPSHLFFLLRGYVVLDGATMPVVGDPETANNTYVTQIVASARAALAKAEQMGVIDANRVGVGGHSYGAFMTANLLAHCDLFRAGIARSGAYNRTLTPFGFQNERRTLWEAPDIYIKMSPFLNAHKIKAPLLLIHGEADNNPGTFYVQSERMYQAVKGNGGTVRFVSLPHESHGYRARESVEHTLYEMMAWFDTHMKNAPARAGKD